MRAKNTTNVVKRNCTRSSREARLDSTRRACPGGSGRISGAVVGFSRCAQLKTNFVYVKYINYIFKWLLSVSLSLSQSPSLSPPVKPQCRRQRCNLPILWGWQMGVAVIGVNGGKHGINARNLIAHTRTFALPCESHFICGISPGAKVLQLNVNNHINSMLNADRCTTPGDCDC